MIDIKIIPQKDLDTLFAAVHTIRETLEQYDEWKSLMCESDIYRECFNTEMRIMNEERRRLLESNY